MNWPLLQNSLLLAGTTTALALGFGVVTALWLATLEARRRNAFLALAVAALALPPFLVTNCWIRLLGDNGLLRAWLPFGIYSLGGTIWILSLQLWPISLLAGLSGWRRLEAAQFECEPALTGFALLRWLLLPVARGELALAAVVTFVLALNNFAVPAILQTKVLPDEMWVRFNTQFDAFGALRLSLPLVLAPVLLLAWLSRRAVPWPRIQGAVPARVVRRQLGSAWRLGAGTLAALLLALSLGLPLAQIALEKRTWTELAGAVAAGTGAIWNSLWCASLAATVVVLVALAISTVHRQRRDAARRHRNQVGARTFLSASAGHLTVAGKHVRTPGESSQDATALGDGAAENSERRGALRNLPAPEPPRLSASSASLRSSFAWLPFFVPGVVIGIALIKLFNRPGLAGFYQSAGIVVLALALRYAAVGWTAARHAIGSADPDLADAARLEGATRGQLMRLVLWPQIAPQLGMAWYVVYLLCLWDVESIVIIQPPGGETLALKIFNLLHYGHAAQVNALCLILLGLAVAPLGLAAAFRRTRQFLLACEPGPPPRALTSAATMIGVALLGGCAPSDRENAMALRSQCFERAVVFGARGVGLGEFNKPRSVAVDRQDNFYVVDMTGRVQKLSPDGQFILSWQMPQTDLGKPKGMACDGHGNIVVVEPHYSRVNHFTPSGELVAQWGERGTNAGQLGFPRAVAVNGRGEIYVCEYAAMERVQRFAVVRQAPSPSTPLPSDGRGALQREPPRLLSVLGKAGTEPGEFNRPEGLAVDAQDRLYVADSCNHRIQVFSADGRFLRAFGKAGSGLGELSYPYDVAVDPAGKVFVCEFGNSRIQVFDSNGQAVEIIGGPGAEPGRFANPWSIALDSRGNLYVADSQNHRVQKLVRRGQVGKARHASENYAAGSLATLSR